MDTHHRQIAIDNLDFSFHADLDGGELRLNDLYVVCR